MPEPREKNKRHLVVAYPRKPIAKALVLEYGAGFFSVLIGKPSAEFGKPERSARKAAKRKIVQEGKTPGAAVGFDKAGGFAYFTEEAVYAFFAGKGERESFFHALKGINKKVKVRGLHSKARAVKAYFVQNTHFLKKRKHYAEAFKGLVAAVKVKIPAPEARHVAPGLVVLFKNKGAYSPACEVQGGCHSTQARSGDNRAVASHVFFSWVFYRGKARENPALCTPEGRGG
jgi:hypothetical protein